MSPPPGVAFDLLRTVQMIPVTGHPAHDAASTEQARLLTELIQIGIALTSERNLGALLERIVAEARRLTRAEAGTLFLREADALTFAVAQNDVLAARYGEAEAKRRLTGDPLVLGRASLASFVCETGQVLNLADAHRAVQGAPFAFDAAFDARTDYRTESVLVVPLQEPSGFVLGVLQLINAVDQDGAIIPFHPRHEAAVRALASQAAIAIHNARLEELSFKDALTDVYNRRYFKLRLDEETKRHVRFGHPLSLVYVDVDRFKTINDDLGHGAGDSVLRTTAQLLLSQSRSFTTVTRHGGDEFAILLGNTTKAGAITYANRIKGVIERYPFDRRAVTVSIGVATLPDDARTAEALVLAADTALYDAKRSGRNTVGVSR